MKKYRQNETVFSLNVNKISRIFTISDLIFGAKIQLSHTVRNLHFLSKKSTLISRENSRFFWVKNS